MQTAAVTTVSILFQISAWTKRLQTDQGTERQISMKKRVTMYTCVSMYTFAADSASAT